MIIRLPTSLVLLAAAAPMVLSQGTDLGGGITTRRDVAYLADLALDNRDIDHEFASTGGTSAAMQIYTDGKNSDSQGGLPRLSLSQLSSKLASTQNWQESCPLYLFHLYGMADRSTDFSTLLENRAYADGFVRTSITAGRRTTSQAISVLNMWMYASHLLFDGAQRCLRKVEADQPDLIDFKEGGYDEFIALYIGTGQVPGSSDGFSLYALAEQGDDLFDVGDSSDPEDHLDADAIESLVNKRIKSLYQTGASLASLPEICTSSTPDSPERVWAIANEISTQMYIPLFQLLINAILEKDSEAAQVYAMALVPQAAQCRPSIYKQLRDQLLGSSPSFDRTELVLQHLQDLYSCFGLTCEDIGKVRNVPAGVTVPECKSAENDAPMAQYQPGTDVLPIARIDHDVLQLRVLTSMGSFFNARMLYTFGRNSPLQYFSNSAGDDPAPGYYSIRDFATAASRKNADPFYNLFVAYHNDPNYAHSIISETLEGSGKWGQKSIEQRSAVIAETSAFMVLYIHLLAQMYNSVDHCNGVAQGGEYDLTHPWDEVAALLIGALEGTEEGGASDVQDGQLVWGLSTRRGFQFQTLNKEGYPRVNSKLEDLLFAGRGELDALDCEALSETVESIRQLTMVPILQSILRYGIQNEQHNADSTSEDLALGETYALALVPIIWSTNPEAAQVIEENMIFNDGIEPTRDGAQTLANAIGSAAASEGIRCSLLGSTSEAKPCPSSAYGLRPLLFSSVAGLVSLFLMFQ